MEDDKKLVCGIVRPIGDMDGYSAQHWADVHAIICDALDEAGFETRLVSDADTAGVIQGRIVKNLYENDLIVCDVSGKNPNVMFELGMRLAFDKPTIVIKDDITAYSFDTSPIEHIPYPRDLRFNRIIEFKERLTKTSKATAIVDPDAKSFLQHFGPIKVAQIEHQDVPAQQFIVEELKELRIAIANLSRIMPVRSEHSRNIPSPDLLSLEFSTVGTTPERLATALSKIERLPAVRSINISNDGNEGRINVIAYGGGKSAQTSLVDRIDAYLNEGKSDTSSEG